MFCVGANKTGTTSMQIALRKLGYRIGNQAKAELLIKDWARGDFQKIVAYCRGANAFQDVPFSYPNTFRVMDAEFPGSKFILTLRSSTDEWYESLVRFHTKLVGKGRIPTVDDLRQFGYRYPGFLWDAARLRYGADESKLYDREHYGHCYEEHNRAVMEHFKDRPNDLLVLNVSDANAMERLMTFLGYPYNGEKMPHANASKEVLDVRSEHQSRSSMEGLNGPI